MKIAVCYSGGFRTFPLCCDQNHQVLSKLGEVDYYLSTWEKPCYTKVARYDDVHAIAGDTIYDELLKPNDIITAQYLIDTFKFFQVDIETMVAMDHVIQGSSNIPWTIMSPTRLSCQYYKMYRCNHILNLSRKIFKKEYDLAIRLRSDVTISNIPDVIDPSKIYLSHMVYADNPALVGGAINEMIYISNPENMNKICNIWHNFSELWNINDGVGEVISYKNLVMENLVDKCELFDFGMTVVRENGNDEYIR